MARHYRFKNLHNLLNASFTESELRDLCFYEVDFNPVFNEISEKTGKNEIIRRLLEYAKNKGLLASLLDLAKAHNPAQYEVHQPYDDELHDSSSPPKSIQVAPPVSGESQRLRVFLCHTSGDKPAVRELYQRLRQEGFIEPWLDEEALLPGQDWQQEIPKAVRAADVVLVCLSNEAITKAGYVQKEIKFALDVADEQPEGTLFLIPLRLEPCQVPERLRRWHWANLFEARGYERLLRSLRARASAVGVKTRPPQKDPPPSRDAPPPWLDRGPALIQTTPDLLTLTDPIHLELVRVPAGEFLMGSDPARDKDAQDWEQPQHRLHLAEFYIGKYPVTNEQYAVFVKATGHRVPVHWKEDQIPHGKANHPVVFISWYDAVAFCDWLRQATGRPFRLPGEAEWEKAARGVDGRLYPWGDDWDPTRLNSYERGAGDTTPVGRYSPAGDSPYEAADLSGNVWEWTRSLWGKDWQTPDFKYPYNPEDGREDLKGTHVRVLRGGSWGGNRDFARCAVRDWNNPGSCYDGIGVRVVSPI